MDTITKTLFMSALTVLLIGCGSSSSNAGTQVTPIQDSSSDEQNSDLNVPSSGVYSIVDTNQVNCYDSSSGDEESCTGLGYDADYYGNQISYTTSASGNIVTDNVTDLSWTQSTDMDGDGITSDNDDKMLQTEAVSYCNALTLDGYSDWRLPDIKTLFSLILFSGKDPSGYREDDTSNLVTFLDGSFTRSFGDVDDGGRTIDGQYATTTLYESTTMNGDETMFGVNFIDGRIKGYPTRNSFYVHCVRGNEDYGINNFIDNNDATINDEATSLMWEQDSSDSSNWDEAISTCEDSTTGNHNDWRLPNIKELQSIVDYSRSPDTTSSAAINQIFNATSFINEEGEEDWGSYWSSTTHANNNDKGDSASYLSFGRALGSMGDDILDVHGAGAQRSDGKISITQEASSGTTYDGSTFYYFGPQGDILRLDNKVRCVRDF